jgi:phospholipid/cholesterol/gamma-HCH transport system ATP-binding protein
VVRPASGSARFLGLDWSTLDDDEVNALRALIGRVFYRGGWLDHLSVADNVLMPLLHHTREPRPRLLDAAALMAREFGLPGLPTVEPALCTPADLQRAACVRAFLGAPRLVLLEHPTVGLYPEIMSALVSAIRRACNRGAAVLWMTRSQSVWRDAWLPVTRRLRLAGRVLLAAGGGQ